MTLELPIARLYTFSEMTMPVRVVRGRRSGPHLFVCAALHGDEINGVEIIRRLLQAKLLRQLRGALIAVPIVNVYGFVNRSRYLPDRRDLNRAFPGSAKGSMTASLAHLFMDEVAANASHGIDLHTGSDHRTNLPHVRATLADAETARLARAFGAPVIVDAQPRDDSLRQAVTARGLPTLVYEGGEALRFDETAIRVGLRGVLAVMRTLEMLPRAPVSRRAAALEPLVARSTTWVRAPKSGVLNMRVRLGASVQKGEALATISDPLGTYEDVIRASAAGIIIGRLNLPLVHRGDALFHIAVVEGELDTARTAEAIENSLDPELEFAMDDLRPDDGQDDASPTRY
jgi:hypothetical protein